MLQKCKSSGVKVSRFVIPQRDFLIPKGAIPKLVLLLIGPMINKNVTCRFVRNNINIPWRADNSKIKRELNISFRPMRQTMEEAFQVLIDNKIIVGK